MSTPDIIFVNNSGATPYGSGQLVNGNLALVVRASGGRGGAVAAPLTMTVYGEGVGAFGVAATLPLVFGISGGRGGSVAGYLNFFSPMANGVAVAPTVGGVAANIFFGFTGIGQFPPGRLVNGDITIVARATGGSGGSATALLAIQAGAYGVWPPAANFISVAQSPGYVTTNSSITSQLLQANAVVGVFQQTAVGVFLLANAIAQDSPVATATLQTFVSASAQVYASINQSWYGTLNVNAIAAAPIAQQYYALAAAYANATTRSGPVSTAAMNSAITVTMLALALADGKAASSLLVNATASTSAIQLYAAMTTIIANAIAATTAVPQMAFMMAASANALAAVAALPSAAQFAALLASANAYVRVSFNSNDFEGWVLNALPRGKEGVRGFTTYQNFPYTSFAVQPSSGNTYATGPLGVYLLKGKTDSGVGIPGWVRSGLVDFGSRHDKRMESLYVGYTSDDRLVAKMITTNEGLKVETWYTMRQTQLAGASREGRIEIGKGLHSVYWGFELHNNAGANFTLDVVALWPVILDRRIS